MDFIAEFENIAEDMRVIFKHIAVDPLSTAHENFTQRRDFRAYDTPETEGLVTKMFLRFIECFGYEF